MSRLTREVQEKEVKLQTASARVARCVLSYVFIFCSPILSGMFLPLILCFWIEQTPAVFIFAVYTIAWLYIWSEPLDEGRNLALGFSE